MTGRRREPPARPGGPTIAAFAAACLAACGCGAAPPRGPAPPTSAEVKDLDRSYLIGPTAARELGCRIDFQATVKPDHDSGVRMIQVQGDSIFVLDGRNFLVRLQHSDGAVLWRIPVVEPVDEVQAITYLQEAGRVFLTITGELLVVDRVNGALLARQPLEQIAATAPALYDAFLIYGSRSGQVVWHSVEVGYQWKAYKIAPSVRLAPLLVDSTIVAIGTDGRIVALDAGSATGLWDKRLLADVVAAPASGSGLVYVAGRDQYLWAIDVRSGRTEWSYLADAPLESPPAVIADRVYQGIPGRGLVAFEAQPVNTPGGKVVWTAPSVSGNVLTRLRDRLLVWDAHARRLTVVELARGGVVTTVNLPQVRHLQADGDAGALVAAGDDGRVIRLVPHELMDHVRIRRALLSVSDKEGLVQLATGLARLGVELVSTGGSAEALRRAGLTVIDVAQLTGVPEMMGGRVKTLHPAVHGAVLARRDVEGDRASLEQLGAAPIDLVCVNLYPFEEAARRGGVPPAEVIEQIDIGGPALLRSAAKNHAFVAVLTAPRQYPALLEELDAHGGATTLAFRRELAAAAFRRTAAYDAAIAAWMEDSGPAPGLAWAYAERRQLRYGENPHQAAALYVEPGAGGVPAARVLLGGELSYNNLLDAAAALELVGDLHAAEPGRCAAAIIKHGNACGAAWDRDPTRAFEMAHAGDPVAAYGGILALSAAIDGPLARAIVGGARFLEVIVAPQVDPPALAALGERWKNLRVLACGALGRPAARRSCLRSIPGGLLVQAPDAIIADPGRWSHAAGPAPGAAILDDARLAWTLAKHLKSNAVAIAAGGTMLGAGFGQVDRVTACRQAVERAGPRLGGDAAPVAASDAFFPFADGPAVLIDAGVRCIVHPGGSKRDQETLDLCRERGVTCMLSGTRHFRH